jgi:hypothetical protein
MPAKIERPPEIIKAIVNYYKEYTIAEIRPLLGNRLSLDMIRTILIEQDVKLRRKAPRRKRTQELDDEMKTRYASGESKTATAKSLSTQFTPTHVSNILRELGVITRAMAIYTVNHSFFDIINTPAKAYALGLFYTDGNNRGRRIIWNLQSSDAHILGKLKRELEYTGPLLIRFPKVNKDKKFGKSKQQTSLEITSKQLGTALTKLGAPPRKTFKVRFPTADIVPVHLMSHFLRGVLDGDGSVSGKKHVRIAFAGNPEFVQGLRNYLVSLLGQLPKIVPSKRIASAYVCQSGQLRTLRDYLYKNCGDLYFPRKRAILDDYLAQPLRWEVTRERVAKQRAEVVRLRKKGLMLKDIAKALGITLTNTKAHVRRARAASLHRT